MLEIYPCVEVSQKGQRRELIIRYEAYQQREKYQNMDHFSIQRVFFVSYFF